MPYTYASIAVALFILGLLIRLVLGGRPPSREGKWMRVVHVGKWPGVQAEWELVPAPDPAHNDEPTIRAYAERLLASEATFPTLLIATPDGNKAFGLWRRDGEVSIHLGLNRRDPSQEAAARSLIESEGAVLEQDRTLDRRYRSMRWRPKGGVDEITNQLRRVLTEVYRLPEGADLFVTFQEREDRSRTEFPN